jgi:hypothetical protein
MKSESTCNSIHDQSRNKKEQKIQKHKHLTPNIKHQTPNTKQQTTNTKGPNAAHSHLSLRDRVREIGGAQLAVVAALREDNAADLAILNVGRRVIGVRLQHDEGAALLRGENLERARLVGRRNDAVRHLCV